MMRLGGAGSCASGTPKHGTSETRTVGGAAKDALVAPGMAPGATEATPTLSSTRFDEGSASARSANSPGSRMTAS
eukprot:7510659-Alexandrium_andersonii.AAC.1